MQIGQWSLRARTTASALLIVGTALVGAAVALVLITQNASEDDIRAAARLRAGDFVALLGSGTKPSQLHIRLEEDVFVQIVDEEGEVQAASPSLEQAPPAGRMGEGESTTVEDPKGGPDPFLVVAENATTPHGEFAVLVGRNLDSVREETRLLVITLLAALPLLLIVAGTATWASVGRALSPVEAIRQEVAVISGSELHRRVPDPGGDDEIARLARTMNHMLDRLEIARAKQQRLVSDASHEFRNPLAAIRQHAEAALAHPDQTTAAKLADDVLSETLRLQRIADDLLFLARVDEHAWTLARKPLDLDDVVLEEAARLKRTTALQVHTKDVSPARTHGDALQLQRLIRNLADNAARYAASTVRLALSQNGTEILLEVDDDGPGIPAELRELVFERFSRLDQARGRDEGGAGLGLAIVAEIAQAHGGVASVEEASLGGARFEVVLPVIAT